MVPHWLKEINFRPPPTLTLQRTTETSRGISRFVFLRKTHKLELKTRKTFWLFRMRTLIPPSERSISLPVPPPSFQKKPHSRSFMKAIYVFIHMDFNSLFCVGTWYSSQRWRDCGLAWVVEGWVKGERNEKYSVKHMSDGFEIDGITVTGGSVKLLKIGWERFSWRRGRERCRFKSSKLSVRSARRALI